MSRTDQQIETKHNREGLPSKTKNKLALLLLTTSGLFSWAIRGQAGYGAIPGCIFAGTLWGLTWYFLSAEETAVKKRRYGLGWVVAAFVFGIGISGMQGWGDIVSMVRGELLYQLDPREFLEVSKWWGLFYLALAGFHWAGTGTVFLAWCGSKTPATLKTWAFRILSVALGVLVFWLLLYLLPHIFLPNYELLDSYNYALYPKLPDLYAEIFQALLFTGAVLGALTYEILQKDWLNVKIILIPALVTGITWMGLIVLWELIVPPWAYANDIHFNWWRCWESTGGAAIGFGFGLAFIVCNQELTPDDPLQREQSYSAHPNAALLIGLYLAALAGLAHATIQSIKGALHIDYPHIPELDQTQAGWAIPVACLFLLLWGFLVYNQQKNPFEIKTDGTPPIPFIQFFIFGYLLLRIMGLNVTRGQTFDPVEFTFFLYYVVLAILDLYCVRYWWKAKMPAKS